MAVNLYSNSRGNSVLGLGLSASSTSTANVTMKTDLYDFHEGALVAIGAGQFYNPTTPANYAYPEIADGSTFYEFNSFLNINQITTAGPGYFQIGASLFQTGGLAVATQAPQSFYMDTVVSATGLNSLNINATFTPPAGTAWDYFGIVFGNASGAAITVDWSQGLQTMTKFAAGPFTRHH